MKFNIKLFVIFMIQLCSFEAKDITEITPNIKTTIRHIIQPTILRQNIRDTFTAASKHIPTVVKKTIVKGYADEGNKKSHHDQGHDNGAEKKLIKGSRHKSFKDSSSSNKGSDTKENHNKQYEEEGGQDKKTEDEANESSFHEEGDQNGYGSHYKGAKKHKVRKFEQGFFKSYHKKERNKKSKFFEDQHKGGEYKKYGQANEKHYSTDTAKKSFKDGKKSSSSSFSNSKKRSKIK